jgi:ABC-type transport system substrate-binding protein
VTLPRRRRIHSGAVVLALVGPLTAGAALGPRYGGTARVGVVDLVTPAPAPCRSGDERLLWTLTQETLVQAGPEGHPVPALASGWNSAASRREWTLQLRAGAVFHDGTPVTPDDTVRSLRRFLRSPSPAAEQLALALAGGADYRAGTTEALGGLAAGAAGAVVLRLERARALPLAPLAAPAAAITSAGGAGAGPFAPAPMAGGRRAAFVAAGGHFRGRPYLDRVEVNVVPEGGLAGEIQSGRVDVAAGGREGPLATVLLLTLDATRPPFDNDAARAAVAAAVDRTNLVRHLLPGSAAAGGLLPPLLLPPLPAPSPAAAAALRTPASLAVSREVPSLVSQRVVAHLTDVGLQVQVDARHPARILDGPPAHLRLWLWSPEVAEAGLALRELARLGPRQAAVEDALAAADAALDADQRRAHYYRAEAALRAANVVVPLAAVPAAFRAGRRLLGVRVDAAAHIHLEDAWWQP